MKPLAKAWATPLTVVGVVVMILVLMQLPGTLMMIVALVNKPPDASEFAVGQLVGAVTANVVFVVIGLWLLLKGRAIRKRTANAVTQGSEQGAG